MDLLAGTCVCAPKHGAVHLDAHRAGEARAVGDEEVHAPAGLSRPASSFGSMLPPLTTATVGGPGSSCSRAAKVRAPAPSATTFAAIASSGMADRKRGSGTVRHRSTHCFKSSNLRASKGAVVPSAIVSGLIVAGPPPSSLLVHRPE